jgi:threonine/homoserine/homoserine lactone efflux protein
MELIIFIKGFLVGLVLCAPFGPIGVLIVRRTLVDGSMAGVASVLGASTVDGLYCAVAGLGVSYISNLLRNEQISLKLAGGVILILVGIRIFYARPREKTVKPHDQGLVGAYLSTFLLMLANPMPILIFGATFSALGVHGWRGDYADTLALVGGVVSGSALWAPLLVALVSRFKTPFNPERLRLVNRIAGAVIFGFGLLVGITTVAW